MEPIICCRTCKFWEVGTMRCLKRYVNIINPEAMDPKEMRVHVWPSVGEIVHNVFTGPEFSCTHWAPAIQPECVSSDTE